MTDSKNKMPIVAKKSYSDGKVAIDVKLKSWGHYCDSAKIEGRTVITTAQARELAAALIQEADKADAKVATKAAHEDRRKKWREREIAAGRMKVFTGFR